LVTEFEENENDLRKRSLIDQERHHALEMLTSEIAHTGRERENTPAKQQ
jgi:hypothetical protein